MAAPPFFYIFWVMLLPFFTPFCPFSQVLYTVPDKVAELLTGTKKCKRNERENGANWRKCGRNERENGANWRKCERNERENGANWRKCKRNERENGADWRKCERNEQENGGNKRKCKPTSSETHFSWIEGLCAVSQGLRMRAFVWEAHVCKGAPTSGPWPLPGPLPLP